MLWKSEPGDIALREGEEEVMAVETMGARTEHALTNLAHRTDAGVGVLDTLVSF